MRKTARNTGLPLDNFVVFEGLDGAGTTTQAKRLHIALMKQADQPKSVTLDFEPTDGAIGRMIRDILRGKHEVDPWSLALLFAADRNEHLYGPDGGLVERLQSGARVVCDRYLYSSLAYQGVACGYEEVCELNRRFPHAGTLIYLDVPVEVCLQRITGRGERELFEKRSFLESVLHTYEQAIEEAQREGASVHRIDGTLDEEAIAEKVCRIVQS